MALEDLLALAKTGYFHKPGSVGKKFHDGTFKKPPKSPIAAISPATPTLPIPPGLSAALDALTAAERALLDNPAALTELVAELPTRCGWECWPMDTRRNWITERLGLSACRFWTVTRNGQRYRIQFSEPQPRQALQEQATRNRPGETITLQPTLLLKTLSDNTKIHAINNAIQPVDNFSGGDKPPVDNFSGGDKPPVDNFSGGLTVQQTSLLPDTALLHSNLIPTGPGVNPVSAATLLQAAGVTVRYLADPEPAQRALQELATLPDTGPWGLDIETAPLPAFRTDSKAGLYHLPFKFIII